MPEAAAASSAPRDVTAIIVAAGGGTRIGFDKLLAPLAGEPVILRTLRAFEACADIAHVLIVAAPDRAEIIRSLADAALLTKITGFVEGGAERHFSVWNGLSALPETCAYVAVHDGARPLIHPEQITRCVARARETGAAACARRVTETLKRADDSGLVTGGVDRAGLWLMETPQVFRRDLLVAAYEKVLRDGLLVTDEVSAVEQSGHPVWLVENRTPNLKITLPGDLEIAARLLPPPPLSQP